MPGYTIFTAAPGTGLTSAVDRLANQLRDDGLKVQVQDAQEGISMQRIVRRPRHGVVADLTASTRLAVEHLEEDALSDQPSDCLLLRTHLTIFNRMRSEFYPVSDKSLFDAKIPVDRVVVLIDDIYDMFRILSAPGEVFEYKQQFEDHCEDSSGRLSSDTFLDDELGYLDLECRTQTLQRLLAWRRNELLEAERLARAFKAKLTVLGTKHALETGVALLNPRTSGATVYISHPISRPRSFNIQSNNGEWPEVVNQCNLLPGQLASSLTSIMPTAIDEFRLGRAAKLLDRPLRLSHRWPRQTSLKGLIGGTQTDEEFHAFAVLGEDRTLRPEEVAAVRQLELAITSEVPFRDHLLVSHTDHFFVFRPLYEKGTFSGGVNAEIKHWKAAYEAGESTRRAAILHTYSDVKAAVGLIESNLAMRNEIFQDLEARFNEDLQAVLLKDFEIHAKRADCRTILKTGRAPLDMLENWGLPEDTITSLTTVSLEVAARRVLYSVLTSLEHEFPPDSHDGGSPLAVFFLPSDTFGPEEIRRIGEFLLDRSPAPPFQESLESALGSEFSTWARSFASDTN